MILGSFASGQASESSTVHMYVGSGNVMGNFASRYVRLAPPRDEIKTYEDAAKFARRMLKAAAL